MPEYISIHGTSCILCSPLSCSTKRGRSSARKIMKYHASLSAVLYIPLKAIIQHATQNMFIRPFRCSSELSPSAATTTYTPKSARKNVN